MLAFHAPPVAVSAPVTQNGKIAGMINVFQSRQRRRPNSVGGLAQVGGDRHRAGDHVEQDVPLRAERHEQHAAEVDRDVRRR